MEKIKQILVVEDNEIDAFLITSIIHHCTPEVEVVHKCNGKEALEYLYSHLTEPDLIILDLNMPVMDGFQFMDHLKQNETLRNYPVFILSSSDHHYDLQQSSCLEIDGYFLKPLEIQDYKSMLEHITIKS